MGFTTHYSRNAFFILIAILVLFAEILGKKKEWKKTRYTLLAFLGVTELVVAKRGPLLFLILAIILMVLLKEPILAKKIKNFWKYIIGLLILATVAVIFIPGANNLIVRVISSAESGDITTGRWELYLIGLNMFLKNPVLGQGWDGFRELMVGTTFQGIHNDYIQLLSETGLVGFAMTMIVDFSALKYSIKAYKVLRNKKYNCTEEQIWLSFSLLYQIFFILYSLTGFPHFSYDQNTLHLMTCGYGVAMYRMLKNDTLLKNQVAKGKT
jgi:O-antigen ligase